MTDVNSTQQTPLGVVDTVSASDIHDAIDRKQKALHSGRAERYYDISDHIDHAQEALKQLQHAADLDTWVAVEVTLQQLVMTLPAPVLEFMEGPLSEARWYVYDRTGEEHAISR